MDNKAKGQCFSTTLINGDGILNAQGLDKFIKQVKLGECGLSYAIVAIMGPQSSGKSTLLNHLFKTNFTEMDSNRGRRQTTKGIWMARCTGITHCTIAMDLEGSDGSERGEDTLFERQIALFAIAVSDIMLINIWCHDIGREHGANKPLLRIVFQEMLRIRGLRKTTLMLVIRDKSVTPFEVLERDLMDDMKKIWDSVPKGEDNKNIQLSECFNVKVVALSNYERQKEEFGEDVANMRESLFQSIRLAKDHVPGSAFSLSAQNIWELVKENKEIDFPSHKVMVATKRCHEIAEDKYSAFADDKIWLRLEDGGEYLVRGFKEKLNSLLKNCLSSYDAEAFCYDATIASAERKELDKKLMKFVRASKLDELTALYEKEKKKENLKHNMLNAARIVGGTATAGAGIITVAAASAMALSPAGLVILAGAGVTGVVTGALAAGVGVVSTTRKVVASIKNRIG
ncbi:hypothetical protein QVD17_25688 [Tagetes erecta]|uniref:GB1/RHD3-type G domain-containing protein n=1 Tax=Tagetes erecta TaxID=13708 RepID=A0AAD8KGB0_TARER|nr:hypothetical protein QVD17_25688 [Tagetes erecta]